MFLHQIFLALLLVCTRCASYTYEPPGRDPVSIDKIRNSEQAVVLTTDNFDELTKGKLVFIKFYAPYCPHCKSMAGAWNELAAYYNELPDSDNILIGSIDCTNSPKGKELCARFKIMGLPSLFYGDASLGGIYLDEYGGDKTFEDLKSFAAEALVPKCNPGNLDACSADMREEVETYMALSYEALNDKIQGIENREKELRSAFKKSRAEMQKNYDDGLMKKELKVIEVKSNIKLIKEIIAMKQ